MATMADEIAKRYGDDGLRWYDKDDVYIVDALLAAGAREERYGAMARFDLPDGSAIVVTPGGWDHGFRGCFCMAGLGHEAWCPRPSAAEIE